MRDRFKPIFTNPSAKQPIFGFGKNFDSFPDDDIDLQNFSFNVNRRYIVMTISKHGLTDEIIFVKKSKITF